MTETKVCASPLFSYLMHLHYHSARDMFVTLTPYCCQQGYCCDSLLIVGSGRTCNKDTGSEGNTLRG